MNDSYNRGYYKDGCGRDYSDADYWLNEFNAHAKAVVEKYNPKTFLDVGCAFGYFVAAMRDLGVEAYGLDISEYAISNARDDIKPYLRIQDPIDGYPVDFPEKFDCVSAIEVAEHLREEDADGFIHFLCSHGDTVIFSSTPTDFTEVTHHNVQQKEYWAKRFAKEGFFRDLQVGDLTISPQTMVFRKTNDDIVRLVEDYEHKIRLIENLLKNSKDKEYEDYNTISELNSFIEDKNDVIKLKTKAIKEKEKEIKEKEKVIKDKDNYSDSLKMRYNRLIDLTIGIRTDHNVLLNSLSWKITLPFRVMVKFLANLTGAGLQLRDAIPEYLKAHAYDDMLTPYPVVVREYEEQEDIESEDTVKLLPLENEGWYRMTKPLVINEVERDSYRLNVVTDSISENSLLGGVATALIVATKYCLRHDMELRLITRDGVCDLNNYYNIVDLSGIERPKKVTAFYDDIINNKVSPSALCLDVSDKDIFFATSWWSATAIQQMNLRKKFFYIIQEVESFFYTFGDAHLFCSRIMEGKNINYIVNSHFLWDYFKSNCNNIVENGVSFEPAFPEALYPVKKKFSKKTTYRLFFYARPNNPRNLFYTGSSLISKAIELGILDASEWEICFVGTNIPEDMELFGGVEPNVIKTMNWKEYGEFLQDTDLTVSLMYTPHPSYPPYDAAYSGSVVLTNSFANKKEIEDCDNIIVGNLIDEEAFMEKFREAVELAKDMETRERNYRNGNYRRDWNKCLQNVIDTMDSMEEL